MVVENHFPPCDSVLSTCASRFASLRWQNARWLAQRSGNPVNHHHPLITVRRDSFVVRLRFARHGLGAAKRAPSRRNMARPGLWPPLRRSQSRPWFAGFFRCTGPPLPLREGCKSAPQTIRSAFSDTQDKGVGRRVMKYAHK